MKLFNKTKTKYYLLVYAHTYGHGNSTYTVIGENPYLNLQQALNTIQQNDKILNPIIINIIELTKEQHSQFNNWANNDRKI
jgi:hypothetical protein